MPNEVTPKGVQPDRMKGNPGCSNHEFEHDWNLDCAMEPRCKPIESVGEERDRPDVQQPAWYVSEGRMRMKDILAKKEAMSKEEVEQAQDWVSQLTSKFWENFHASIGDKVDVKDRMKIGIWLEQAIREACAKQKAEDVKDLFEAQRQSQLTWDRNKDQEAISRIELSKYLSMSAEETVVGGIRNLAQAYESYKDNSESLQKTLDLEIKAAQLSQDNLTKRAETAERELKEISGIVGIPPLGVEEKMPSVLERVRRVHNLLKEQSAKAYAKLTEAERERDEAKEKASTSQKEEDSKVVTSKTLRGFTVYDEFKDYEGKPIRIQERSSHDNTVWIFTSDCLLNKKLARRLVNALQRFTEDV